MKNLFLSLIVLVVSIALTSNVSAQSLTQWTWKDYGLSFKAPSNMKVTKNTDVNFEATNGNIHLAIEVMDYSGASIEDLAEAIGIVADQIGMSPESEVGALRLTTLTGVYIEGTLDGANIILTILADEDSNIALWAVISYVDGQENTTTNMVNSFSIK